MTGQLRIDLANVLGDLAIQMQDQSDSEAILRTIVDGAVAIVPGARWAGISMIQGRRITARVPSDPLVAELDGLQSSLDEGPCISALREHRTVHIDNMSTETQWPRFSKLATERGVGSLLAFQLFAHSGNLGALNLYGAEPGAFDEDSVFVGELLAQHASVALVGAADTAHFRDALATRDLIGQAKGILMYRENLTDVEAFALLVKTSQESNIKLVEIARWVVEQQLASRGERK